MHEAALGIVRLSGLAAHSDTPGIGLRTGRAPQEAVQLHPL